MLNINEEIAKDLERLEELKRQRRKVIPLEKTVTLDVEAQRRIIVGRLVIEVFPELLRIEPTNNEAENDVAFAWLGAFLTLLVDDREYINRLKATVDEAFKYEPPE